MSLQDSDKEFVQQLVKKDYHYIRMHGQQNIKICTVKQVYLYKTIIQNLCIKLVKKRLSL